jgi:hypothetical protein
MLLDIGSVLGGIGLAVVAFVVVILVCVVILRLLAAILPSYEDRDAPEVSREPDSPDEDAPSSPPRVPDGTEERRE